MKIRNSLAFRLFFVMLLSAALAACATAARPAATPTAAPNSPATPLRVDLHVARQADGTTVVQDLDNAYQFALGQEWTAVPVTQQRVGSLGLASPVLDAEFLRLAQDLLQRQMDAFRLVGMNTNRKFAKANNPTLVLVTAIPDRVSATLPMPELAQMIVDTVFTDSNAVERNVVNNANGMNIAVVEGPYDYYSTQGDSLKTRSKVLGFQSNSKVILIQFITPVEFGSDVLPGTDPVIDTIQRLKP